MNIKELCKAAHNASVKAGWFNDPTTGKIINRNLAEMLCLMHSEISEAMEGVRKGLMDDHLPHRTMEEVELADLLIRVADYAEYRGLDLTGAIIEKMDYNARRADHKLENRAKKGGKAF